MTHSNSKKCNRADLRDESGMALLIAVILLLLMSALGLAALQHSGDESADGGRSRRKDSTLYAAEAGQAKAQQLLYESREALGGGADWTVDDAAMVTDAFGNPIAVRMGVPGPSGLPSSPMMISQFAPKTGVKGTKQDNGMQLNKGGYGAASFPRKPWRVEITAQDVGNGLVHLQAQYAVLD
jgi:hypothetical protein